MIHDLIYSRAFHRHPLGQSYGAIEGWSILKRELVKLIGASILNNDYPCYLL